MHNLLSVCNDTALLKSLSLPSKIKSEDDRKASQYMLTKIYPYETLTVTTLDNKRRFLKPHTANTRNHDPKWKKLNLILATHNLRIQEKTIKSDGTYSMPIL